MLEAGIEPYPVSYPRTASIAEVRGKHGALAPDTATGETVWPLFLSLAISLAACRRRSATET